ncbi:Soluble aldose sugar dehydrogenase YliI precursor [Roseimaritima multifibrata]|uniref:Soluble aldose sugar dehydrogenase YliI n=1 Tax=Roseimaritima multifibrata TaxID=1930274 RepID=A0A517MN54_9BACT|nr:DUF4347 domain-containing protein [Roseimaritima multifibrata]QDS96310.1 Soluble aldose sugar dehydrogenase YliI precursor [Roseimaritima multifibrata]
MFRFSRLLRKSLQKNSRSAPKRLAPAWETCELEPRVMLAGDAGAVVADAATAPAAEMAERTPGTPSAAANDAVSDVSSGVTSTASSLLFVDSNVADFSQLTDQVGLKTEVILLDSARDGLDQISEILARRSNISSIHLLTHGQAGQIELAGQTIDRTTLENRSNQLQKWANALTPDADILLYGCHTGADQVGAQFVRRMANLTGADVAASNDMTGHKNSGGDWELEQQTGSIETSIAFAATATETYQGVLPISIRAAGATGEEQMSLQIDGVTVQTWNNIGGDFDAGEFETYTFDPGESIASDRIRVTFNNDIYEENGTDRNLRVDSITVDGQTLQTEDPSVYSTGTWKAEDGIAPGFRESEILHANGYFQFGQAATIGSRITIDAAGSTGEETMELRIDGQTVQTWQNVSGDPDNRNFNTYEYFASETVTADRIQVAFTNDLYDPNGIDRNLVVDKIQVDAIEYEAEAPEVFSTGSWKPEDGVQPGFRESEFLNSNGYLQFAADDTSGPRSTIRIFAAGTTNSEQMSLQINGVSWQSWDNIGGDATTGDFVAYTYQAEGVVSADNVRVAFTNDLLDGDFDRNLRVDRIEIDGVVFQTEAPNVFSTGTWLPEDGLVEGYRENEFLHTDGYFQYAAAPDNPGVIALSGSVLTASETDTEVAITVLRSGGSDGLSTVDFSTLDGTAIAGEDYLPQSGTLTFEPGQTEKTILVSILNDSLAEGNETFNFAIDNINGGATLLAPRTATVTIADDDTILPAYTDFSSLAGLTLNEDAVTSNNELLITTATRAEEGSAFFNAPLPINVDTSFQTQFQFKLDGGQQSLGADGFTFVLQNDPRGVNALGPGGGDLAYTGIVNSLAIKFDTYQNDGEINNNHISVVTNGDIANPLETRIPLLDINNGDIVNTWIEYNGNTNQLAVYVSDSTVKPEQPLIVSSIDLPALVGSQAYMGFTAATGGSYNNHRILNWNVNLETPSDILPPTPGSTLVGETLFAELNQPTDIDWNPDGTNMYISEKSGLIKVSRNGELQATPFVDIRNQVNDTRDRGLLDIAVHPDFENNPYVYLLYTYDPPEVYDNSGHSLAGPDKNGNRAGRLIRVTADASTNYTTAVAGSEVILLGANSTWDNFNGFANSTSDFNEPPAGILPDGSNVQDFIASDSESHTVGSLAFGADGNLFVSIGDGASYNRVDPRAVRVQDIDNLSGKILRIDPLTGAGLSDNPFFDVSDANANRSKVYQLGLRNPFRITVAPNSGDLFVGDVGWTKWEEINSAAAGANFGWPYYEGGSGTSVQTNGYKDLAEAIAFYNSGEIVTPSQFALNHGADGINAIVLGAVYSGDVYPEEYQGDLFFNDLGQGLVRNASLDVDGNVINVQNFTTDAGVVVSIQQGPDGTLHYVDLDDGLIGHWYFA